MASKAGDLSFTSVTAKNAKEGKAVLNTREVQVDQTEIEMYKDMITTTNGVARIVPPREFREKIVMKTVTYRCVNKENNSDESPSRISTTGVPGVHGRGRVRFERRGIRYYAMHM